MSNFAEVRFEDGNITLDAVGGPSFSTGVVTMASGFEQRNENWQHRRGKWDLGERHLSRAELDALISFFSARHGKAQGFRWKDWGDYQVSAADGLLGTGVGTGLAAYQLQRTRVSGADTYLHQIRKPVAGTVAVQRNASPVTAGAGAGQIAIDTTTGIVTFVADATANATSITPGATTQVVFGSNPGTLVSANVLYLTGFAGADAALVNGLGHIINSVTGSGPYTFTLATNTAGKTITLGSGQGRKYPQPQDALTWSGEYDYPVRFDSDDLRYRFDAYRASDGEAAFWVSSLPLIQLRT